MYKDTRHKHLISVVYIVNMFSEIDFLPLSPRRGAVSALKCRHLQHSLAQRPPFGHLLQALLTTLL